MTGCLRHRTGLENPVLQLKVTYLKDVLGGLLLPLFVLLLPGTRVVAAWEQNGQFLNAATLRQQVGVGHHPCFRVTAFHISYWGWNPSI